MIVLHFRAKIRGGDACAFYTLKFTPMTYGESAKNHWHF